MDYSKTTAARPRKLKKPITSVMVVMNTDEATAGSTPKRFRVKVKKAPKEPQAPKVKRARQALMELTVLMAPKPIACSADASLVQ